MNGSETLNEVAFDLVTDMGVKDEVSQYVVFAFSSKIPEETRRSNPATSHIWFKLYWSILDFEKYEWDDKRYDKKEDQVANSKPPLQYI
jgi:hypothetical protein